MSERKGMEKNRLDAIIGDRKSRNFITIGLWGIPAQA